MEIAILVNYTIYISITIIRVAATVYSITIEDRLYGIISVVYIIVTYSMTIILLVVRTKLVLKLLY